MQKTTWFFKGMLVLALVCGFLLAGCTNPAGGGDGAEVDKTALAALIAEAETERETTVTGVDAGSVPLGTQWVTQAEKDDFRDAINAAKAVNDDDSAGQSQVNQAESTLRDAITAFNKAKDTGTAAPVDTGALNAKITEARTARDSVTIAADAGEVALGASWAAQTQVDALNDAITAAETARDTATNQTAVDTAVTPLNTAITAFNTAVSDNGAGTKTTGFNENDLATLIEKANDARTGVVVSSDGNDVPPTGTWVSQADLDTLNTAISAAEGSVSDLAYLALSDAITDFNNAKKPGTTPDKSSLVSAIETAIGARTGVAIAASRNEAPSGSAWVTQAQWDALETAYAASIEAAGQNATKVEVDTAVSALNGAITAFNTAKAANGPGTATNKITITGLGAIYDDDTEVSLGLFADKQISGNPAISGTGVITGGSLEVALSTGGGAWTGSGSYYVAFMVDDYINVIFISKQTVAFSGAAVSRTYAEFEFPTYSINVSDFSDNIPSISLDTFFQYMTAEMQMPGGPYNYGAWKSAMADMMKEELKIKISLDYSLYKNEACTQEFSGTDTITSETVIYCKIPLLEMSSGGGGSGPSEPSGTVGHITGTISFTGTGQQIYILARYSGDEGDYGNYVDDEGDNSGRTYTVNSSNGSFSIPFTQGFRSALQSGRQYLRFMLYINSSDGSSYTKDVENEISVTASQLSGGDLNVGSLGTVDLGSTITLSGTITVTLNNGQAVPRVSISANGGAAGWASTTLTSPGPNAAWSITMPSPASPTDISFSISGYDSNWENELFYRYAYVTASGVSNTNKTGITINVTLITLSGTVDVTIDGQKPQYVQISAFTDPDNMWNSELGSLSIDNYHTKGNTWTMGIEPPPAGTPVYFAIAAEIDGTWISSQQIPTTISAPTGPVSGIALSYSGSGFDRPGVPGTDEPGASGDKEPIAVNNRRIRTR